jgi:RNA polymerase sigma-70 factor (ECF subfamily)
MCSQPSSRVRARFATTRWSRIVGPAADGPDQQKGAFEELVQAYWYPLYAYIRRRGVAREDAEDLTQGFFAHLLDGQRLRAATPERGRFRNFLLAALRNYIANQWRSAAAAKRGGAVGHVSLDFCDAERRYLLEPTDCETPQQLYDRRWAMTLMDNALNRVREFYESAGKAVLFAELKQYLAGGDEKSIAEVAGKLGLSESATRVALHRLRKRCRDCLRAEVARTLESTEDLDSEVAALLSLVQ